jgi:uncharacterized RDD family membrane protein YckC
MPVRGAVTASMAKRLLAVVVDGVVAAVLGGGAAVAVAAVLLEGRPRPLPFAADLVPVVVLGGLLLLVLGAVQWWSLATRGCTLGMRALGLRALSPSTGRPVGLRRALVRRLVVAAGWVVPVVGPVAVHLSPLLDGTGRRQGWHDRAAGTVVLDVVAGADPTTSPVEASAAVRRLDALLTAPGAPILAMPSTEGVTPRDPGDAALLGATALAAVSGGAVPGGGVSGGGVPGGGVPAAQGASGASDPAPRPAPGPAPSPPARPTGHASAPPPPAERPTGLPDEVERTRLRPARAKVPAVPAGTGSRRAVLDVSDGQRVVLTGTALVGRAPVPGPQDGDVQLVVVADPGRSVSKTHLAIGLDRSGVWVRDRGSTNGTVVTTADGQRVLCGVGQDVPLPPGASVAFGDYGLTVAATDT